MKQLLLPAIILITGLTSLSTLASTPAPYLPLFQLSQNNHQSLEQAVQKIKQQSGGRILSAKTIQKNGQRIHKIKVLLPSGKVRIFKVNAR